jgi:hypothetical protein
MNAVEIEEAISTLAEPPFDAQEFPFLQAFANKETTIKRLRNNTRPSIYCDATQNHKIVGAQVRSIR